MNVTPYCMQDANLVITGLDIESLESKGEFVVTKVVEFLNNFNLIASLPKTNIIFSLKGNHVNIDLSINATKIVNSVCTNVLGIEIDSMLSWKDHIDGVASKLRTGNFKLKQVSQCVKYASLLKAY